MMGTGTMDQAQQTFVRNIEEKTGRTIDELVAEARVGGTKHAEIIKFVQARFGLTYGYANYVALRVRKMRDTQRPGGTSSNGDDPVAAQYTGPKAALRPIYDAVVAVVRAFGDDVELAPKKTYVSLRRRKQFGCVGPATNTRVDVGLNLTGTAPAGRLEAANDGMFTHRVRVSSVDEVDGELVGWLRRA